VAALFPLRKGPWRIPRIDREKICPFIPQGLVVCQTILRERRVVVSQA
jgi:hypothetical protein